MFVCTYIQKFPSLNFPTQSSFKKWTLLTYRFYSSLVNCPNLWLQCAPTPLRTLPPVMWLVPRVERPPTGPWVCKVGHAVKWKNIAFGCSGDVVLGWLLSIIKIASPKGKETLMIVSYLETVGDTIKSYQKPASVHGTDTSGLKTTFTKNQISPRLPLP